MINGAIKLIRSSIIVVLVDECMPAKVVLRAHPDCNVSSSLDEERRGPSSNRLEVSSYLSRGIVVSRPKQILLCNWITCTTEVLFPEGSSSKNSCSSCSIYRRISSHDLVKSSCQEVTVVCLTITLPLTSRSSIWFNFDPKLSKSPTSRVKITKNLSYWRNRIIVSADHHIGIHTTVANTLGILQSQ